MTHIHNTNKDLEIKIVTIGNVSVGKSTLINAILVDQLSDCKMKRTTMTPQSYVESDNISIFDAKKIREKNRQINESILNSNNKLTRELCVETEYQIPYIENLLDDRQHEMYHLKFYDVPGLNDRDTKAIYYDWIKTNFKDFDVIVYIINVESAFNTESDIELFNMILEQMNICSNEYNQKKILIPVVNKCDSIFYSTETKLMNFSDDEVEDMFKDVCNIYNKEISQYLMNHNCIFVPPVPICAQNAFIYRYVAKTGKYDLDKKYINRMGDNLIGEVNWKKIPDNQKEQKIKEIINTAQLDDAINDTGFNYLLENIRKSIQICDIDLVQNHINYLNSTISSSDIINSSNDNNINRPIVFFTTIDKIMNLYSDINRLFKINVKNILEDKINISFDHLKRYLTVEKTYDEFIKKWMTYLEYISIIKNEHYRKIYQNLVFETMLNYITYTNNGIIQNGKITTNGIVLVSQLYNLFYTFQPHMFNKLQQFYTEIILKIIKNENFIQDSENPIAYVYELFKGNTLKKICGEKYYNDNLTELFKLYLINFFEMMTEFNPYIKTEHMFIYYFEELLNNKSPNNIQEINEKIMFRRYIHIIKMQIEAQYYKWTKDISLKKISASDKSFNCNNLPDIVRDYFKIDNTD